MAINDAFPLEADRGNGIRKTQFLLRASIVACCNVLSLNVFGTSQHLRSVVNWTPFLPTKQDLSNDVGVVKESKS